MRGFRRSATVIATIGGSSVREPMGDNASQSSGGTR